MFYSAPAAISSSIGRKRINSGTRIRRLALEPSRLVLLEIPAAPGHADLHLFCRTRRPRFARRQRPLRVKSVLEVRIRTFYGALGNNRPAVPKLHRSVRIRCVCLLRLGARRSLLSVKNPRPPWPHQYHGLLGARHNTVFSLASHPSYSRQVAPTLLQEQVRATGPNTAGTTPATFRGVSFTV